VQKQKNKKKAKCPLQNLNSTTLFYILHTHKKDSNEIVLFIYLVYIYVNI
jgi:hypothetical protein